MIIDYLLSKDGLRIDQVDVSIKGIHLARAKSGFVPEVADHLTGTLRMTLSDLSAALSRPEILNQVLAGIPGIARPEVNLENDENGGLRIVGSVEAMGRRIPLKASTRVRVSKNRLVVSAIRLEGLPLLGAFPVQAFDLQLPLSLPLGLVFTDVTAEPGCLVLSFEGEHVRLRDLEPEAGS